MADIPGSEQFRQWLLSRGDDLVGVTCDGYRCPLAHWLSEVYGYPCFAMVVTCGDVGGVWSCLLPDWALWFVLCLDGGVGHNVGEAVTGTQALAALDEALMEVERR